MKVAKTGSLSRAAAQLGVSPALVTKHLQQIEGHLGTRLFNRTTRNLALTEIGVDYCAFCERVIADIFGGERAIRNFQKSPRGELRIKAPISFGALHLAPIVADFMLLFPDIRITLVLSDATLRPMDLIDKGFDMTLRYDDVQDKSVIVRKIADIQWFVCASNAYFNSRRPPRTPADLIHHNCLLHSKLAPSSVWRFVGPNGREKVKVRGSLVSNNVLAIRAGVLSGAGIGLLPSYCISDDLIGGRAVEVLAGYQLEERALYVLYADRRFVPAKAQVFVDFLSDRMVGKAAEEHPSYARAIAL